ncbi:MAG TPA: flagellar biosynthesis protein FliO [Pseudolabrys sp.]|nr:flagellar biosynthesis protein FliO [Pseudolabrys sp.]
MFESLFGSEMPLAARFFVAFLVVLALIGLTAWLVRRFGSNKLGNTSRGRQPRLAVIDAATVDGRRRLVLIRRDNIEHLLMIGGPTDLVVEPNIVRAIGAREIGRESSRVALPGDAATRSSSQTENGWPLQPVGEAPAVSRRPTPLEDAWPGSEPVSRGRAAESLLGDGSPRFNAPDLGGPAPRSEPAARPPLVESTVAQSDHNLAEMAQQLEAALRRPTAPEGRPAAADPLAGQTASSGKGTEIPARVAQRELKARIEPKFEAKSEPKFEFKPEPRTEPAPTPGKNLYENLEEEMASLLGRPPGKS